MKKITLAVSVLAILATSAVAQHTYLWDDGSAEGAVGRAGGGEMTWLNGFQIDGLNSQIDSIDISWTTFSLITAGMAFNVHLWSDPTNDGDPTDAILLNSVATTVDGSAITANGSVFQTVAISELLVGAAGTWFYVGASITHTEDVRPAAIDTNGASSGQSWFNAGGPGDLSGAFNFSSAFPGNWMVRANATLVPEPGTFIAIGLGLAGLALARWRK